MRKKHYFIILFLLIVSCGSNSQENALFKQQFPSAEMNTKIQFQNPKIEFQIGEDVDLLLQNNTNETIVFPTDYGIHILHFENEDWTEIINTLTYLPPGDVYLHPNSSDNPGVLIISLNPDIENNGEEVVLRIVVLGLTSNGNQVGAFLDVTLLP